MAELVGRLFRDPEEVSRAVKALKEKGYKPGDLGILVRKGNTASSLLRDGEKPKDIELPQVGRALASGPLAKALASGGDPWAALASSLGLPQEALGYYQLSLSVGGILFGVAAGKEKVEEVKRILLSVGATKVGERSPGFDMAERMAESNPLDAKMTGDFRRY